jgi:2-C-methyl-D-erythritol 4-phosphate cytidylyltransferase/2-C-methyl-D-erythritol 4-phosphate cytidylyltransferase/2-C-methyl-D-erythritol 2,4-cyclodiphosphate synthase
MSTRREGSSVNGDIAVVIAAAGSSRRMGGLKKEYHPLVPPGLDGNGRPLSVLGAAVLAFAAVPRIRAVVIAIPVEGSGGEAAARACLPPELLEGPGSPRIAFSPGGPTRRASVHGALSRLAARPPRYVLIHDGARPWVGRDLIDRTIAALERHGAVIPILPLTETPKELDGRGFISRHLRRVNLGLAQTPQGFAFPAILAAHEKAAEKERLFAADYTDDAEVWGEFCGPVAVIPGAPENRKITFPEDLG